MTAVDDFHQLYYDAGPRGGTWTTTTWLGVGVLKSPLDLWAYQEIIYELRPDLIVETAPRRVAAPCISPHSAT